jgi:RHS repeat-associated protein
MMENVSLFLDGEIVQHVEYVPFGEVFIEERNNTWNTPYLFNAKELDEETGLYYYGVRYYDPRISIFYGVDPLVEKTGTPYQYCYQNPVKFIDPTGEAWRPTYHIKKDGTKLPTGYSWIPTEDSYESNGSLKDGLYEQAIFFSHSGTFSFDEPNNMGSSTATVYKADGTTVAFDACTYPSKSTQLTIPEGDYKAVVGLHKGQYTALRMSDDGTYWGKIKLPFANPNDKSVKYAIGVNIHKPGSDNQTRGHSVACFNIDINRWGEFIGLFNNTEQKSNVIGIAVSRTYATPTNITTSEQPNAVRNILRLFAAPFKVIGKLHRLSSKN